MNEQDMIETLRMYSHGDLHIDESNRACWDAFVRSMRNRQYGYEALSNAWAWFQTGWNRAK